MDYGDQSYASEGESIVYEDESVEEVIPGAPIDEDALASFLDRGRTVKAVLHPFLKESFAWIAPDRLPKNRPDEQRTSDFQAVEASIYQAYEAVDETSAARRTAFVLQCAEIYEDLQMTYNDDEDIDLSVLIAKSSKLYKDKMDAVLGDLRQSSMDDGTMEVDSEWQSALVESMVVWCCAEAIYMNSPGELLCDGLMDWVNRSNPQPSEEDGQDIIAVKKPYMHPGFWDFVCKGIIRGLFDMVGTFLSDSGLTNLNSATARATNDLALLLRTCPRVSNYVDRTPDFKERHKVWRAKVALASRDLKLQDQEMQAAFKQVYELLKGDKDAVHRQCDTWQECLAALALLFDPAGVKSSADVRSLFEMITESEDFGLAVDRTLPSEEACAALCTENVPRAIARSKAVDLSLATHLSDLLEKAEVLDDIRSEDMDLTLRDLLVLEMGEACMSQRGTWRAAITYWRTAGDVGLDSIQEIITRIPATTQAIVDELLTICQDIELTDEGAEIESIWARKLEGDGSYNKAILAYDRAKNVHQLDRLNWHLFKESLIAGTIASRDSELRESLQSPERTSSSTIATLMAPYATLAMVYQCKEEQDLDQAAAHLAALLTSSDVPKQYIPLLMAEMLPFLSLKQVPFSLREIFDSLAAMEEYHDSDQYSAGLTLLKSAMQKSIANESVADWRSMITPKFEAEEILSLVRLRLAGAIGTKFCI